MVFESSERLVYVEVGGWHVLVAASWESTEEVTDSVGFVSYSAELVVVVLGEVFTSEWSGVGCRIDVGPAWVCAVTECRSNLLWCPCPVRSGGIGWVCVAVRCSGRCVSCRVILVVGW